MAAYDDWLIDPSAQNMGKVLQDLDPVLTAESARYSGGPVLKTKAKLLAVDAVRRFDPTRGAQLKSWVVTQLQPLSRYKQQMTPLRVPEAAARKAAELNRVQRELAEEYGHNPSDDELSDRVGIPVKRILKLRDMSRAVSSEAGLRQNDGADEASQSPAVTVADTGLTDAADAVYAELDPRSRFIYDASIGGHGKPILSKLQIAAKLGVTPAFISQQSAATARRISIAQTMLGS